MASSVMFARLLQASRNLAIKNKKLLLIGQVRSLASSHNGDMYPPPPGAAEPWIPPWIEPQNEELPLKKARLLYQSRKRGMLENGLILSTFASRYLEGMNELQTAMYDRLINLPSNDWDIFYWATGVKETPQEFNNEVMDLLKEHVRNKDKETRFKQPDLY